MLIEVLRIILKSSSFEYVKNKYTYIGIKSETGYYLYNMFTPVIENGNPIMYIVKEEINFEEYNYYTINYDNFYVCK